MMRAALPIRSKRLIYPMLLICLVLAACSEAHRGERVLEGAAGTAATSAARRARHDQPPPDTTFCDLGSRWDTVDVRPLAMPGYPEPGRMLPEGFSIPEALHALLGGRVYHLDSTHYSEETWIDAWTCASCPADTSTVPGDETEPLPLRAGVDTRVLDTARVTDLHGDDWMVLSLSSAPLEPDLLRTGRFALATLQLAVFRLRDRAWRLVRFIPMAGYYGMFGNMPAPQILGVRGGEVLLWIDDMMQDAGGPVFRTANVLFAGKGPVRTLLRAETGRGNVPGTEYTSRCVPISNADNWPDLMIVTSGRADMRDWDRETAQGMDPRLIRALRLTNDRPRTFTLERRYAYAPRGYRMDGRWIRSAPRE